MQSGAPDPEDLPRGAGSSEDQTHPAATVEPTFVRSSRRYASYTDFWRLVELSGFPVIHHSQIDFSSDTLYVWAEMDSEFMLPVHQYPKSSRRARTVFWCLEPVDRRASQTRDAGAWWAAGLTQTLQLVGGAWVSDKSILSMDPRTTWACFGGHRDLKEPLPEGSGPSYDVAHIGQRTPRRDRVIKELERRGISVSPSSWGHERVRILSSSKLFLDVQRLDGRPLVTPIRWALGAAYRLPMVREDLPDPTPLVPGESILLAPLDKLADRVEEALGQDLEHIGNRAWEVFCKEQTFRAGVEDAVRRTR